jgi:NADH:ubiquinone oxidoreductase subunit 5 (subunit L)/multisubunit Na+/H+ antiporter MnhA subunit
LCAGVFIHHCGTNDMFEIGRQGGRRLKSAVVCTIVGAGALSGLPPFSGFFSKEMILGHLLDSGHPVAFLAARWALFDHLLLVSVDLHHFVSPGCRQDPPTDGNTAITTATAASEP